MPPGEQASLVHHGLDHPKNTWCERKFVFWGQSSCSGKVKFLPHGNPPPPRPTGEGGGGGHWVTVSHGGGGTPLYVLGGLFRGQRGGGAWCMHRESWTGSRSPGGPVAPGLSPRTVSHCGQGYGLVEYATPCRPQSMVHCCACCGVDDTDMSAAWTVSPTPQPQ